MGSVTVLGIFHVTHLYHSVEHTRLLASKSATQYSYSNGLALTCSPVSEISTEERTVETSIEQSPVALRLRLNLLLREQQVFLLNKKRLHILRGCREGRARAFFMFRSCNLCSGQLNRISRVYLTFYTQLTQTRHSRWTGAHLEKS